MQLVANSAKGLVLGIVETRASDGKVFRSAGPFAVDVSDPDGAISVIPGSADQSISQTIFRPNGSGKTGTVTVKVTDTGNNLVGTASFDVVAPAAAPAPAPAPAPVDLPDTLTVSFTAET